MLKKDIIIISAHCPNLKKERKLQDLVENLQGLRNKFDILVISHTPISKEICNKIDHFYLDGILNIFY